MSSEFLDIMRAGAVVNCDDDWYFFVCIILLLNKNYCANISNSMQLEAGRAAVLSVHGTVDYTVSTAPFDAAAYKAAMQLPTQKHGECTTFEGGQLCLYRLRCSYTGVSFLVENQHNLPLVFLLDCTQSVNVVSHRPNLKHQQVLSKFDISARYLCSICTPFKYYFYRRFRTGKQGLCTTW